MLNTRRSFYLILTAILMVSALVQPAHADFSADINTAVGATGLTWTTGGSANWYSQATTSYDSGSAAQSGYIGNSQSTWMQTTVNGPAGLSFYWMVSSESGWDYLRFSIDGVEQSSISGTTAWAQKTYILSPGAHSLTWTYTKDGSTIGGSDAGWVDKIEFTPPPATTASPASGVYASAQDVTLTTDKPSTIYYTIDGSTPLVSGTTQSGASPVIVNIPSTAVLKFFAQDMMGISEAVKTESYIIDLTSIIVSETTVTINNGDPSTTSTSVSLGLTCTDPGFACSDMRLSNDGYTWSAIGSYATSTTWTLSSGEGLKTVYAMFSDHLGNWSRPYSDTIAFDTMPPVNGRWHWRNPTPQGNDLYGTAYGNSTYVAVGALGTVLTSGDGLTWTAGFSGTSYQLSNVTFGNGAFVAVGSGGTILTSATGTIWSSRTAGTTNNLTDITFSNGTFVAVGGAGTILTSSDGITWMSRTSGTANDLNKITFGNGIFVTVGSAGTILTSVDGTTWTSRTSTTAVNLGGIAFGNATFVAVENAGSTVLTSPDGITWTSGIAGNYLYGVAFGNNNFVTVGYYSGDLLTSSTGTTWTPAGTSFGSLYGINYVNGAFMAVGWAGAIYSSPDDGLSWTTGSGISATTLNGVAFGINTFVAVGPGTILASVDGAATWTNTNAVGQYDWQDGVGFGNDTFVSLQNRGQFLTSTDGFTWTMYSATSYMPENNFSVTYGNGTFVAVGNWHQIFTSPYGTSWTLQYPSTTQYFHGVTFGNGMFVAVGGGGTIFTSPDGYTWTSRSSGTTGNLAAVAYGNNMFVAVGGISNSTILTSSDGITWTTRTSGTSAWLNGVTYANGMFVVVGDSGTILFSRDGAAWTPSRSGITSNLNSVTSDNNTFVAVGDNGAILQSDQYLGSALAIAINNNVGATNSTSVTLTLSCMDAGSGCAEMKFSNDNITYSAPVSYATSTTWELTPGGGAKTVSVMFRDFYTGTWSEPVSANIVLDTTAPVTSASTPGGLYNTPQNILLYCNDGAGGGCAQTYYTLDGSDPTTGSSAYTGGYITIDATTTLKFFSVDVYGYSEAIRTEVYTIDMNAPTTAASPAPGLYTAAQDVTMTADEPATIYYTTDGTTPSDPVSGTTQTAPSPALVHLAASTTLNFFAKDLAGNIETPVKIAAYIIDLTSIIVAQTSVTINNNALYTNATSATLALTCTDSGGNCLDMQISNDGTNWSDPVSYATSTVWTLSPGDGLKTVYAMFSDHTGSWSRSYSDTITLDTTPPTSDGSGVPDTWNWRNPAPQGNSLSGITYGNGVFVAVGSGGAIITSTDGVTWAYRTSGTTYGINDITYGNGIFVAVGSYDAGGTQPAILTSTDGINWISRTAGVYTVSLTGVSFNGTGTFVAVGWYGTILTSTDNGATWTLSSGTTNWSAPWLNDVTFGNGTFVAVGASGTILTSANGTNWTAGSSGDSYDSLVGVTYGNGAFVAVGYNYYSGYGMILTLPDGSSWAKSTLTFADQFTGVTYLNSKFIATGIFGIRTSPDGSTWTDATSGAIGSLRSAAFGNATYVAVGEFGAILTSTDADNWTNRTSGTADNRLAVAFGNNTFVSVGASGTILTSTDGTAWTSSVSNTPYDLYGTTYGNGVFVAVGAPEECGYSTAYSLDGGVTWTSTYGCINGDTLRAVTFGNNTFVAVGDFGMIATSADGIDWTNNPSSITSDTLYAVTFGNGIFVAVGNNGTILTSANGIDWTNRDSGSWNAFHGAAYGNNAFVVVGDGGDGGRSILTSGDDGITWTDVTPSGNSTLNCVTFANGAFVAVGQNGAILTSTDGTSWTDSVSVTSLQLSGVVFGNNTFVVVGDYGTVLQSNTLTGLKTLINGGAAFTNTASVTLSLSCIDSGSGCAEMQFSNDNSVWSSPEPYASNKAWELVPGDGPKTVFVKFKDNAGNWSEAYNGTINLVSAGDVIPPVTSASPTGGSYGVAQAVTLSANEQATIYYTTDGTPPTIDSTVYTASINVSVTTTIRFFGVDLAGNVETPVNSAVYIIDTVAPVTTATPTGGLYPAAQNVTLTANEPATIHYTVDGTDPDVYSPSYTGPILVSVGTTTLKYFAVDLVGNAELFKTQVYVVDTDMPMITNVAPATGSFVKSSTVNYTLSKLMVSGSVVYTRTGGTADPSSPHSYTMTQLTAGSHQVTDPVTLVNGAVYSIAFNASDGATSAPTVTVTNVTYDQSSAGVTIASPVTGGRVNTPTISYLLSEATTSGQIVIDDGNAPYIYFLSGAELTAGAHTVTTSAILVNGMTYTFSITNVVDLAGNATPDVIVPNVTFDIMAVVISNTAPVAKSIITAPTFTYELSEQAASGTVTFTWTGGKPDPASPHAYVMTDISVGAHTAAPAFTLIDGAFYTVSFAAMDLAGNPSTTVSNAMVFFDSQYGLGPEGNVDNTGSSENIVDDADVKKVQDSYGTRPGDKTWNPVCDLDHNNVVDARDLMILWSHYGQTGQ